MEVLPVLAEKRENLEVIPVFEEKIQGAEGNENLATLAENIAENKENKQNFRENEIFLRKKHNLLVKIVVNEGEFAHYFDAKDTELLTETDNMSPETTSIIDQFLAKEPKLPRSRNFIGQKEMPVENLLQPDEEEIVTETMAYLYASQGNKAEAMRIYEKLSLQFPEKRLYFAARIKSVINS